MSPFPGSSICSTPRGGNGTLITTSLNTTINVNPTQIPEQTISASYLRSVIPTKNNCCIWLVGKSILFPIC